MLDSDKGCREPKQFDKDDADKSISCQKITSERTVMENEIEKQFKSQTVEDTPLDKSPKIEKLSQDQ